jgi:hypothetical protein
MLEKGRMLAIGVVAVGIMGFGAPMAHAATTMFTPGDVGGMFLPGGDTGLVNVNNDQVNGEACDDSVPVNVIGGEESGDASAIVDNLGSFDDRSFSNDRADTNCGIADNQVNGDRDGDGGLVNVNNDQVNGNACNDTVPVNVIGGDDPLNDSSQVFDLFSGMDFSEASSHSDTNCGIADNQDNGTTHYAP